MQRVLVRELKPYSIANIADLMKAEEGLASEVVGQLLASGIICYRTNNKLDDDESPKKCIANDDKPYQFNWVGLAVVDDWVFICYPKYLRENHLDDGCLVQKMKLIFRALRCQASATSMAQMAEGGLAASNKLPIMMRLIDLFDKYGEYSNYEQNHEMNGNGSINWNRTVNSHLPLMFEGRPIYDELETCKTQRKEFDFITRLHRAVLTECSHRLYECGISEMLNLPEIQLSGESINDLGDEGTLNWRINCERNVQFVTWKQDVLDALSLYLSDRKIGIKLSKVQSFGTSSFYHLWEAACKTALDDFLGKKLHQLPLALTNKWQTRKERTLLSIIPRPKWERNRDDRFITCGDASTLIPDTITFMQKNDGRKLFCIYDAKYYTPSKSGKMENHPGIESVTKQFLYQSAYREFILDHKFDVVINAFLVPGDVVSPYKMARVSFPDVFAEESKPFSSYIDMWVLPAEEVFNSYIYDRRNLKLAATLCGASEK